MTSTKFSTVLYEHEHWRLHVALAGGGSTDGHWLSYISKPLDIALFKTGQINNYDHWLFWFLPNWFSSTLTSTSSIPTLPLEPLDSPIYPARNTVFLPCNTAELRLPPAFFCIIPCSIKFYSCLPVPPSTHTCYTHSVTQSLPLHFILSRTFPPPELPYFPLPNYQLLQSYWTKNTLETIQPYNIPM